MDEARFARGWRAGIERVIAIPRPRGIVGLAVNTEGRLVSGVGVKVCGAEVSGGGLGAQVDASGSQSQDEYDVSVLHRVRRAFCDGYEELTAVIGR